MFIFQCPSTASEWQSVADDYLKLWNFPNCLGAIDGKHVVIRQPANSGSKFHNYKNTFSIILLGLVDAHYRFLFIDVGSEGRCSDGGIFKECYLSRALARNALGLPADKPLPHMDDPMPFFFVADDAFPLQNHIMKPYPQRHLSVEERIFNYRLSRARRCIENAFGTMASRFRVLLSAITLHPDKVEKIVLASCALHNLLRTLVPNTYTCRNDVQNLNQDQMTTLPGARVDGRRSSTQTAKKIRDYICTYVNSAHGQVSWQKKMI